MMRRWLAVVITAVAVAAAGLAAAAPVAAEKVGACSSTKGTIVAVDFHHWGGPIVIGCDVDEPARGIDLLTDEGYRTSGTQHDGPQFVCRIGNEAWSSGTQYPTPSQDACVVTPPSSAYWSYWLASAGQNTWHYSQLGAYSNRPKPGEVQLWIFGSTHLQGGQGNPTDGFPVCTPNSLRAGGNPTSCTPASTRPSPTTSAPPRHRSTSARPTHRTSSPSTHSAPTSSRPTPSARAASSTSGSSPAPSSRAATTPVASSNPPAASASTASAASAVPVAVDAKPASKQTSAGSALPLVVGLGLASIFALGGGWLVWRRRRAG